MNRDERKTFDDYYYAALTKIMTDLRSKNGRTCEDISLILDISPNTFFRYESGYRAMPVSVFRKLCAIYNVEMKDILNQINDLVAEMMIDSKNI